MSTSLEVWIEKIESRVISVKGFSGIGIVDYGYGEKIEIAVVDNDALQIISGILKESQFKDAPISIVIVGKTTFL